MTRAIIIHRSDNVATALESIPAGRPCVLKKDERRCKIVIREAIPMGHKFSLCGIRKGEKIIKYGEPIGRATDDIDAGCHVHTHNVESRRGRGDLKTKGGA